MKYLLKSLLGAGLISCATALMAATAAPSQAQPAYGSYLGVGVSFGLSEGSAFAGEEKTTSALLAARYKFLEVPISLRTQIMIGESTAVVPTISYDIPVNFDTDLYIGAGAALTGTVNSTPVGNQNAFVLQPGIDYAIPNSNLVLFGNAIFAFNAFRSSGGTATSLQTGVGFRF